jgi:hypothetical protein
VVEGSHDTGPRAFGRPEDLDLDFGSGDRPGLVTDVLTRCGGGGDAQHWWRQPVGTRIAALLRVLYLTERASLELRASCRREDCRQTFEFDLPLDVLLAQSAAAGCGGGAGRAWTCAGGASAGRGREPRCGAR